MEYEESYEKWLEVDRLRDAIAERTRVPVLSQKEIDDRDLAIRVHEAKISELLAELQPTLQAREDRSNAAVHEPRIKSSDGTRRGALTTSEIAECFDGLHLQATEWKDLLGRNRKWLNEALAVSGQRGIREKQWNPVLLGGALVSKRYAKPNSVRARFQTRDSLRPFLDDWKTYEADHFDNP
jgi:hypothetical protein